jgi:hypothetical protein
MWLSKDNVPSTFHNYVINYTMCIVSWRGMWGLLFCYLKSKGNSVFLLALLFIGLWSFALVYTIIDCLPHFSLNFDHLPFYEKDALWNPKCPAPSSVAISLLRKQSGLCRRHGHHCSALSVGPFIPVGDGDPKCCRVPTPGHLHVPRHPDISMSVNSWSLNRARSSRGGIPIASHFPCSGFLCLLHLTMISCFSRSGTRGNRSCEWWTNVHVGEGDWLIYLAACQKIWLRLPNRYSHTWS